MKGDFSRLNLFDPLHQYTRVMSQQGRVQLDADWNEQADILLHYLRTLAADLIGPFGAPANADGTAGTGFKIGLTAPGEQPDLTIAGGRYYVDGLLCAMEATRYSTQPHPPDQRELPKKPYLIYLDVWERHVTYLQDDFLREVALGGADTATRAQVVWQVRITTETADKSAITADVTCRTVQRDWTRWVELWQPGNRGLLKAQAKTGTPDDTDPCLSSPDARYRGENQLYRVEIHNGGTAALGGATFKWSRDNGSVVYPVLKLEAGGGTVTATLEHLGRDDQSCLTQDDWVEIVDGAEDLRNGTDPLLKVKQVDPDTRVVTLDGTLKSTVASKPPKQLALRRWDHRRSASKDKPNGDGVFAVQEGKWLDLKDGVQIFFAPADKGTQTYRSGDYWLIPARVATGDVVWPREKPPDVPKALPPHGVRHHYAPLGLWTPSPTGEAIPKDCRTTFGCRAASLSTGVADWQVVEGAGVSTSRPASLVEKPDPGWDKLPGASWISFSTGAAGTAGTRSSYELSFDLCPCSRNPALSLSLLADDSAAVFLNDKEIPGGPFGGPKAPPALIETTALQTGKNVLRVVVANKEAGPTGFSLSGLVDWDGGSCC
jgi:hypothetical protein